MGPPAVAQVTWGAEDEEGWRRLSFRHWPSLFSYYNITLAKRYISILPVIPVTLHLSPQEATLETQRHPQDNHHPPPPIPKLSPPDLQADLTLYKVAALGLAAGVLLVLLLFCLYRVLCPRNYGQNGVSHGRRRRHGGDLPCDDYGYSPPVSEISPLLLRGHSMDIECLASDGMLLASCCLAGQIRVWDAQTGDCLTVIPNHKLRRSSSSGCWEQRGSCWDGVGGACNPESLCWEGGDPCVDSASEDEGGSFRSRRQAAPFRPPLFTDQPDLTPLIDTNFGSAPPPSASPPLPSTPPRRAAFDFGGLVERAYMEHEAPSPAAYPSPSLSTNYPSPSTSYYSSSPSTAGFGHSRRSPAEAPPQDRVSAGGAPPTAEWEGSVWAMELRGNLIAAGRSTGKLQLWDAVEGSLRCSNEDGASGITALAFLNNRIVAARLNGSLDFFTVEINKPPGLLQYRGAPGRGSVPPSPCYSSEDLISCQLTRSVLCAHQKPITVLKAAAGRVVTGSQDHTVRVYRLEDSCCLFTLQGHSGAITAIYIDETMVLASGGQDGAICLWDVLTGSRVSHVYGHRGDVTSVVCTNTCVISSGLDDLICIWDRSTGIKLYSIQQEVGCGDSLGVISDTLLVTGGQGCVSFWDLNFGDLLQTVYLGQSSDGQGVRQLLVLDNAAIVCDFGSELSLVYVPSVLEKLD